MNLLIINTSPKRKGGASRFFSKILRLFLSGCKITVCDVRGPADYNKALSLFDEKDAVIISTPLYVDAIPAHMLPFLQQAEVLCREKQYSFRLYVMSNCGFVEGRQNALHLEMYKAWCERAGISWCGGIGIGGGVMLHVLFIFFLLSALKNAVLLAVTAARHGCLTGGDLWSCISGTLLFLFFISGVIFCQAALASAVVRRRKMKNLYTRPMIPSFVFLPVADLFMLLSGVFSGTWPHRMFSRIAAQNVPNPEKKPAETAHTKV